MIVKEVIPHGPSTKGHIEQAVSPMSKAQRNAEVFTPGSPLKIALSSPGISGGSRVSKSGKGVPQNQD